MCCGIFCFGRYLVILIFKNLLIFKLTICYHHCIHFNGFCILKLHACLLFISMSCSLLPSISSHGVPFHHLLFIGQTTLQFYSSFSSPRPPASIDLLYSYAVSVLLSLHHLPVVVSRQRRSPAQLCPTDQARRIETESRLTAVREQGFWGAK